MTNSIQPTEIALKYGENPHQKGFFIPQPAGDHWSFEKFTQLAGESLSFVNRTDVDRILTTMRFARAALATNSKKRTPHAVAIAVKHGNPCGAAYAADPIEAVCKMADGDRQAIFGGVVMLSFEVNERVARELLYHRPEPMQRRLLDIVIASGFTPAAISLLERKEGRCKILANPALACLHQHTLSTARTKRHVHGGTLVQEPSQFVLDWHNLPIKRVGKAQPKLKLDLAFAAAICATSTSNTITLVKNGMLIGQGVGQTKRNRAAWLAVEIARQEGHDPRGAVAVSDSFFPFEDGAKILTDAGVAAIFATTTENHERDASIMKLCAKLGTTFYSLPDRRARMFFGH